MFISVPNTVVYQLWEITLCPSSHPHVLRSLGPVPFFYNSYPLGSFSTAYENKQAVPYLKSICSDSILLSCILAAPGLASAADLDPQLQTTHAQKIKTRSWLMGVYPESAHMCGELTLASHICSKAFPACLPHEEKAQTTQHLSPAM